MPFTILITGARSGIGFELVKAYLQHADTTVVAAVRDPSAAPELKALPVGASSRLIVVKILAESDTDAKDVASDLQKNHGIDSVDIVVANAAIREVDTVKMADVEPENLRKHFNVNTIGPIVLFGAFLPLLRAAPDPKFVVLTSLVGSSLFPPMKVLPHAPYSLSKTAVNFALLHIHHEHPEITTLLVHPGAVTTEKAKAMCSSLGFDIATLGPIEPAQSAKNIIDFIAETGKDSDNAGKLVDTSKGMPAAVMPW